jgi:tetratricopeptide (TPR) repeat protein
MKIRCFITGLICLFSITAVAQRKVSGTVYQFKENGENIPLENVYIKVPGGGTAMTKKNGQFSLAFDNSKTIANFTVIKRGFEVINDEQITSYDLTANTSLNIYLDQEGNTEKRIRTLKDASVRQIRERRQYYYRIIDNGGPSYLALKAKLEQENKQRFANEDELRAWLYDKYGADVKSLDMVLSSIVKLNLDHQNARVEQIKNYIIKGDLEAAINMMHLATDFRQVIANNKQINLRNGENKGLRNQYTALIGAYLNAGKYAQVDSCYRLIINSDTTQVLSYLAYGVYLSNQQRHEDARRNYERCLVNTDAYLKVPRSVVLSNLAMALKDLLLLDKSKAFLREAVDDILPLAEAEPRIYGGFIANSYGNMASILTDEHNLDSALLYRMKSVELLRELTSKFPQKHAEDLVFNGIGLAQLQIQIKDYVSAEDNLNRFVKLYEEMSTNYPDQYDEELASILSTLGTLHLKLNRSEASTAAFERALSLYRHLYEKNPQRYKTDMASTYNNLGNSNLMSDSLASDKYFNKALVIYRELAKENVLYKKDLAEGLTNHARFLSHYHHYKRALAELDTASGILEKLYERQPNANDFDLAQALTEYGTAEFAVGEKAKAAQKLSRAVELYEKLKVKSRDGYVSYLAIAQATLASVYEADSERYQSALDLYSSAVSNFKIAVEDSSGTYDSAIADIYAKMAMINAYDRNFKATELNFDLAYQAIFHLPRADSALVPEKLSYLWTGVLSAFHEANDTGRVISVGRIALKDLQQLVDYRPNEYAGQYTTAIAWLGQAYQDIGERDSALKVWIMGYETYERHRESEKFKDQESLNQLLTVIVTRAFYLKDYNRSLYYSEKLLPVKVAALGKLQSMLNYGELAKIYQIRGLDYANLSKLDSAMQNFSNEVLCAEDGIAKFKGTDSVRRNDYKYLLECAIMSHFYLGEFSKVGDVYLRAKKDCVENDKFDVLNAMSSFLAGNDAAKDQILAFAADKGKLNGAPAGEFIATMFNTIQKYGHIPHNKEKQVEMLNNILKKNKDKPGVLR